ncbi:MAG TPA: hypothetical protein PKU97_24925 [Kofleriaceae bacterium]|nr:hypothetical protein [Kofleriaceae bacterium]
MASHPTNGVGFIKDGPRVRDNLFPDRCQEHRAGAALQELSPQLGLQLLDLR